MTTFMYCLTSTKNYILQLGGEKLDIAVTEALNSGYRHFDAADMYGNEEQLGKTLKKWFDKGGKREELFITSKVSFDTFTLYVFLYRITYLRLNL